MIVDAHNHLVWPNTGAEADRPDVLYPQFLIDSGVIDRAWILSTGACLRHPYADQDEAVLDLARQFPDFCVPFAYLDFDRGPDIVAALAQRGFAGLKAIFPSRPYDDESHFPFYEAAERLRMPVVFHVGGAGYDPPDVGLFANEVFPYRAASRNMVILTLDLVAKAFPNLTMVAAHMGGRDGFERCMELARKHPNVHFDIACSPLSGDWLQRTREVIEFVGADSILFGSDCRGDKANTWASFWKLYFATRSWASAEAIAKIMGENAERIIAESRYNPAALGIV